MSETIEILVPDIGDFKDVPVIEIAVGPGDLVTAEQTLIMLESDKATLDVPSPFAGRIVALKLRAGDRVSQGSLVALLEPLAPMQPAAAVPQPIPARPMIAEPARDVAVCLPTITPAQAVAPVHSLAGLPHASPSIRHLARELGIDLCRVQGSGPKGRITQDDLHGYVRAALAATPKASPGLGALGLLPWPEVDFAKYGPVERKTLSKIRKVTGANLSRNAIVIPHVTNFDEADVTDLETFRNEVNRKLPEGAAKLTMLAFMIKAAVSALLQHPTFNASLDGDELVMKRYFHIGFAADTPGGLMVPVIMNVDRRGLFDIATQAGQLAGSAREGKLKQSDMQGGSFTISSLGGIGGNGFTPIINAPEVAILGAARARTSPVWDGSAFVPRQIMPVSLSWDHRVIDGAEAARFLVTFTALMADFRRISL